MMKKRRAEGVQAAVQTALLDREARRSLFAPAFCAALPLVALSGACTLTNDAFDPALIVSEDAGALGTSDAPSALPEPDADTSPDCTLAGVEGLSIVADDPRCSGSIGLLPSKAPAAVDAGDQLEPAAALSLPPCDGELGAFEPPEPIIGLDFDDDVFGPWLSTDGRTLYFSAYADGEQQIYAASRNERGRTFEDARELAGVNSPASDGSPYISADGERLYLFSERLGGLGGRDVWLSRRASADGVFSAPELLASINSPATELLPWLSSDELSLIFVSNRNGGQGGADLWMATRDVASEDFEAPINLAALSSDENEGRAVLSADGLTAFFSSDRGGGRGGPDVWVATREARGEPFSAPRNLGSLNSPANDQDVALSSDDTELFFASSRGGSSALWRAERRCE